MSGSLRPYGFWSLTGSSVHGILQARILEWVAVLSSTGFSRLKDWTHVSCLLPWQMGLLLVAPPGTPLRKLGCHKVYLDLGATLILVSETLKIKPVFGQTAIFSLVTSCPLKAKNFSKWLLSSFEEAWEGEKWNKSSTYCSKVEPEGTLYLPDQPSGFLRNKDSQYNSEALLSIWIDFLPKWRQQQQQQH